MLTGKRTYINVKGFLSTYLNRKVLTFLFFVAISSVFWLFQALDMEYEEEFKIPVRLVNVPRNVVITTPLPDFVTVTLRDKGSTLLNYRYGTKLPPIVVDFANTASAAGQVRLLTAQLIKQVGKQLNSATKIVSISPDTVEYYFNYGLNKRIPVKLAGHVAASDYHYISSVILQPDSVTVFAARHILDTITAAYTTEVFYREVTDSLHTWVNLNKVRGAKFEPQRVALTIKTDRLTEKTIEVPIETRNVPDNKVLRTFPARASVTFQLGMSEFKHINAEHFSIFVDYNDVMRGDNRVKVQVGNVPPGVLHIKLAPNTVEYVIEELGTSTLDTFMR